MILGLKIPISLLWLTLQVVCTSEILLENISIYTLQMKTELERKQGILEFIYTNTKNRLHSQSVCSHGEPTGCIVKQVRGQKKLVL